MSATAVPTRSDIREWLVYVATSAAEVSPCAEERKFGHLALEELCTRGHLDDAGRAVDSLVRSRCTDNILRRFSEDEVIVDAMLLLGRYDAVRPLVVELLDFSLTLTRKSDREYGIKRMFDLLGTRGVDVGEPKDFRMEKQRVAHLQATLAAPLRMTARSKEPRRPVPPTPAATLEDEARRELSELGPDTWNVHSAMFAVPRATKALVRDGRREAARKLVADAVARLDVGDLDGRGFASGGAYVALAEAARCVDDLVQAEALVDRGLAVAKEGARVVRPEAARVYARIGATAKAIAQARMTRDQVLIAEILRHTRQEDALAKHLATVDPANTAKFAWGVAYDLMAGEDCT